MDCQAAALDRPLSSTRAGVLIGAIVGAALWGLPGAVVGAVLGVLVGHNLENVGERGD